jgi:hypothetical protein
MRADAAENAEYGLNEEGRLHEPALEEVGEIVEMSGVVALELEPRAGAAERAEHEFDVLVCVAEHKIARVFERLRLPVVPEGLETVEHRKESEIHRAHVERSYLGLESLRRLDPLLDRHIGRATRGQVHDRLRRLLDARQEARERLRALVGPSGLLVARVQMDDRRSRFGGADRRLGHLSAVTGR